LVATTSKGEIVTTEALVHAIRDAIARAVAAIGLAGVALIHLLDVPGKFEETPYMGWLYLALIVGCVGAAGTLVHSSDSRAWTAAALLPLGAIGGYVLTRTIGLPQAMGDIGNWTEPLGLASLFVEGGLVTLATTVLAGRARLQPVAQLRPVRP
jgi:hypothetical protein